MKVFLLYYISLFAFNWRLSLKVVDLLVYDLPVYTF